MDQRTFVPQEGTHDAEGPGNQRPYFSMSSFCSLLIMFCGLKCSAADDQMEDRHFKWTATVGMRCEEVQMMEPAGLTMFRIAK
jgi:hypothetical protein